MHLEELTEREHQITFEAFDELVISSDSQDWGEEVVKSWYFSALLAGMGGRVVLFGGSEC